MIGDNIKRFRTARNYSQGQLALKLNISQGAVSQWEKGKTSPDTSTLIQIAKIFDVSLDELTNDSPIMAIDGLIPIQRNAVPIVGNIVCGTPILADHNIEGEADLPQGVHADFALRCKGDSMTPTFLDGDLVLIRQQPEVEQGQIAAVGIGEETTLKHFYRHDGGFMLTADNPQFSPIYVPSNSDKEIVIYGLAVGFVRYFK